MGMMSEIENRVSCRDFDSKEVNKTQIDNILNAGRLAPSAKNRQPWRFILISDSEVKKTVLDACYGAESIESADKIIAVCTTNINYVMPNGQLAHPSDLTFASSFMVLQAEHEGLGSCIVTTYNEEILRDLLTIPFSMRVFSLIAIGYKKEGIEIKHERNTLANICNNEHW